MVFVKYSPPEGESKSAQRDSVGGATPHDSAVACGSASSAPSQGGSMFGDASYV